MPLQVRVCVHTHSHSHTHASHVWDTGLHLHCTDDWKSSEVEPQSREKLRDQRVSLVDLESQAKDLASGLGAQGPH